VISLLIHVAAWLRSWYVSSLESTPSEKRQDAIRNIIYYYTNVINGVSSTTWLWLSRV